MSAAPSTGPSRPSPSSAAITLTPQIISSYQPAKVFRSQLSSGEQFTSLGFDDRGEHLLSTATDGNLQLFDARKGKHTKEVHSFKYGAHAARFTHSSRTIIYASTKESDDIRYMNVEDKSYIRYFKGHSKRVNSLEMSPKDDTFLSGAEDDTVRLWDLRSSSAQGLLNIAGRPSVAYDPSGMIFAVCLNLRSSVLLYDRANFDKAPFHAFSIEDPVLAKESFPPRTPIFTSVSFSNDGKWLLVGTAGDVHYVVDAYAYTVVARLVCPPAPAPTSGEGFGLERSPTSPYARAVEPSAGISGEQVKWSPDARYVISGSIDGRVHIWDVNPPQTNAYGSGDRLPPGPECTLLPIQSREGHQGGPSRAVAVNPRAAMFASAGNELAMWLPNLDENGEVVKSEGVKAEGGP